MNPSQTIPSPSVTAVTQDNQIKILVAVYEKHARELLALEESQEKMILLVLGVFSVMIAFLVKDQQAKDFLTGHCERKILLCLFSLVLAGLGGYITRERNTARRITRGILVKVEAALELYRSGAYLTGENLYEERFYHGFPKAKFMGKVYWFVIAVAAAFCAFVLSM